MSRPLVLEPLAVERERYASAAGSAFTCASPRGGRTELVLAAVTPLRASASQESFSLEFHGAAADGIGQGIHALDHPALGRVDLFLVPVGIVGDQLRYEAIFNRLVLPSSAGQASQGAGRGA